MKTFLCLNGAQTWLMLFCVLCALAIFLGNIKWNGFTFLWLLVEILFCFINTFRYIRLNKQSKYCQLLDYHDFRLSVIIQKFTYYADKINFKAILPIWFFERPLHEIKFKNVQEFFTYGFTYKMKISSGKPEDSIEIEQMLKSILEKTNLELEPGYNEKIKFKAHLLEDLRGQHYPLFIYTIMEIFGAINSFLFKVAGFEKCYIHGIPYYYISPQSSIKKEKLAPILFLHGLGIGILAYLLFLKKLALLGNPIIIPEFRHISFRFEMQPHPIDQMIQNILKIINHLYIKKIFIIGHSYGTFVASRFLSLHNHRIKGICFLDPVCCLMFYPNLISNFIYNEIKISNIIKFVESIVYWLLVHEPSIACSVSRDFDWTSLTLWPDVLPQRSLLVLSRNDVLLPFNDVLSFFEGSRAKILCHPYHIHASFVFDASWQDIIVNNVNKVFNSKFR